MCHLRLASVFLPALLFCLPFSISPANATLLMAGDSELLSGTTLIAEPDLAGSELLNDTQSDLQYTFFPSNFFGGTARNRVVRSTNTGNLIFTPRFESPFNITFNDFLVDRIELFGFGDFTTDVNYRTDSLGDRGPNMATRSADGDSLTFDFLFPLVVGNLAAEPHETSRFLSIETNANHYNLNGRMLVHGRHPELVSGTFTLSYLNIAVPTNINQVSEPNFGLLLFAGLLLVLYKQRDSVSVRG